MQHEIISYSDLNSARQPIIHQEENKENADSAYQKLCSDIQQSATKFQTFLDQQKDLAKQDPHYKSYNYQNAFNQALSRVLNSVYPEGLQNGIRSDYTEVELQFCLRSLNAIDALLGEASEAKLQQLDEVLQTLEQHQEEYPHLFDIHNRRNTLANRLFGFGLLACSGVLGYATYLRATADVIHEDDAVMILALFGAFGCATVGALKLFWQYPASFKDNLGLFKSAAAQAVEEVQEEKKTYIVSV